MMSRAETLEVLETVIVSALDVIYVSRNVLATTTRSLSTAASAVTLEDLLSKTLPVSRESLFPV